MFAAESMLAALLRLKRCGKSAGSGSGVLLLTLPPLSCDCKEAAATAATAVYGDGQIGDIDEDDGDEVLVGVGKDTGAGGGTPDGGEVPFELTRLAKFRKFAAAAAADTLGGELQKFCWPATELASSELFEACCNAACSAAAAVASEVINDNGSGIFKPLPVVLVLGDILLLFVLLLLMLLPIKCSIEKGCFGDFSVGDDLE